MSATLTVVITYDGTAPEEEVTSYTSAAVAFDTLTATQLATAARLMKKAVKATSALHGGKVMTGA